MPERRPASLLLGIYLFIRLNTMKMNKKGITPLIATFLLIGFAVALGAIVMSWGTGYVVADENTADTDDSCDSVSISLADGQVCYDKTQKVVGFAVKNTGQTNVVSFKITAYGNMGSLNEDIGLDQALRPSAEVTKTVAYSENIVGNSITQIRIIPSITDDMQGKLCIEKSIDISDVAECK
jgi:FlaG/FlaF family flagellin (archaellin)